MSSTSTLPPANHAGPGAVRFAVVDVETTGLDPYCSRIVECAVIECDLAGDTIDEWSSLVSIPGEGELGAQFVHGISRAMLANAPSFTDLSSELVRRLADRIIVGHVVQFDLAHLGAEFARAGVASPDLTTAGLCTRDLAERHLPPGPRTLEVCCQMAGLTVTDAHTALGDARATAQLLRFFVALEETSLIQTLRSAAASLRWPLVAAPPRVAAARRRAS